MLVELVWLRRDGKKLSPEEIRAANRSLVDLTLQRVDGEVRASYSQLPTNFADYGPAKWGTVLYSAQVVRMRTADFLVVGMQDVGTTHEPRLAPQAWWCRLPADPGATKPAMDDDVTPTREERRAARLARS